MKFDGDKVLITGVDGMVGSYVDFGIKTSRSTLDVTDLKAVLAACQKYKPEAIIHLAAETDVDKCERDPAVAYLINSIGASNVAVAAKSIGAKLVYISTAGVFDGEKEVPYGEDDIPNPQNNYGRSKFLGELAIKGTTDNFLILRACWMFGGGPAKDGKFISKIVNQIKDLAAKEVRASSDQFGSPTFGKDLIGAIKILLAEGQTGVFHMANAGSASRYDVAKIIIDTLRPDVKVSAVESSFFQLDAKRPKNETLVSKLNLMRDWQEALKEYLETEWKQFFHQNRE